MKDADNSRKVPGSPAPAIFQIRIAGEAGSFPCRANEPVLLAMRAAGQRGLPVGCRGGGCGICRVQITRGEYRTGMMSNACVTEYDRKLGLALACRVYPESDMEIVPAPLRKTISPQAKAA